MAIIADVLTAVDATASSVGSTAYNDVAAAVIPVFRVGAVLLVAMTGINLAIQAVPMTLRNGLSLITRIALVWIFLSSYANFDAIYGVLAETPSQLGGTVLEAATGATVTDLYGGLDELYGQALDLGQAVSENGGYISGAMASLVMFVIAALMATVSIIVICAAKLMIAVLIVLGPLAIACTMFKQSASVFEAWVKMAMGFAFVPLLTAAMAGFTIATSEMLAPDPDAAETIGDIIGFVVVMMLGTGLMFMVPTLAQSLAATSIGLGAAAAGTYQQAKSGAYGAAAGGRGALEGAAGKAAPNRITSSTSRRAGHAVGAGSLSAAKMAVSLAQKSVGKGGK
ncbi:type IV secretion system protein [Roseivivax sediminis]|uniref:Type IV secretion system protein VirB6 n=1 Tax=Roseivivax sediminis TaxID=936889 RepID=A0A1I2E3X9_9RHOB|nr:type IV secretion system protein [Roseivivax sediminis]SFE87634.1 type IV secretion system protein VirB6 [Roseivivax sediminis]